MFAILRLIAVLWILGFIALALAATSSYLFSTDPERAQRFSGRLSMALLWPIAVFSAAGRARLRRGF
jgi:hypothetical protein